MSDWRLLARTSHRAEFAWASSQQAREPDDEKPRLEMIIMTNMEMRMSYKLSLFKDIQDYDSFTGC